MAECFKISAERFKSSAERFKGLYHTAHTYSVILIPLLVCSYLYYHGIQILSAVSHIKIISKKRPTDERISSYLNKKGATNWDEKTVKEVLCSLRAKNLSNSNDIAESEENGIPNLPTVDVVHNIKPVGFPTSIVGNHIKSSHTSQNWITSSFLSLCSNPG